MSGLVVCSTCNAQVAYDAPNCLGCGTPGPKAKKNKKLKQSLWLLVAIFTIIVLGYAWFVLIPEIQKHGLFYKAS